MASPISSSNGLQFDSLEDIHIFILSNILRRPIIVIAGTTAKHTRLCTVWSYLFTADGIQTGRWVVATILFVSTYYQVESHWNV